MRKMIFGLALGALTSSALADPTAEYVLEKIDKGDEATLLIMQGDHNGMAWANAELERLGRTPLFCAPRKLTITSDENSRILRDYVASHPEYRSNMAGAVLLRAYQYTFPCPTKP